jgi:hypothetical protein
MFNTVVWASDGSETATRALPYARALLAGDGAMLIAVHIMLESEGHPPTRTRQRSLTLSRTCGRWSARSRSRV